EDIPVLARRFLEVFATKNRKRVAGFTDEALRALAGYAWPGNVRELENVVERAVILCRGDRIGCGELPLSGAAPAAAPSGLESLSDYTLDELELAMIKRV